MNTGQVVSLFQTELNNDAVSIRMRGDGTLTSSTVLTASDQLIQLTADNSGNRSIRLYQQLRFANFTTTERDALSALEGGVIYNSTTNKLQIYNGSSWIDLH